MGKIYWGDCMTKRPFNSNARKAIEELKQEIAGELSVTPNLTSDESGIKSRKLVELGQRLLIDDEDTFNPS